MNFDLVDIEIHLEDSLIEEQALIKRGMKLSTPAEQTQNLNALLGRSMTNTVQRFIDHDIKAAGFFISMLFMIISLVQALFMCFGFARHGAGFR